MKTLLHTAVNGLRIEYVEPAPKVARSLATLESALDTVSVSYEDMTWLVFGDSNPLLEPSATGRPEVTAAVAANPVFRVMRDLLERKHMATRGVTPEALARSYTLTVAEAAERIGISASAVRQAIAAERIAYWIKNGTYYLHPKWTESFRRARLVERGDVGGGEPEPATDAAAKRYSRPSKPATARR